MIQDLKLQTKIKWVPHEKQQEILDSKAREIAICAGRKFGKSAITAYIALKELLQEDKRIWVVAPTYDLSKRVFDYLVKWYLMAVPNGQNAVSFSPNRPPAINLKARGSFVEGKSIENPAGLLGQELDLIIVDEAARIPRNIWEGYIAPNLTTRRGRAIFISTPFGKNWFWEKWLQAKEQGGAFTFKSVDNPFFPKDEWERAKLLFPERVFNQEYMALFEESARVFRGVKEIISDVIEEGPKDGRHYVMGVDLGKYRDWTVVTVVDRKTHNVVHWDRFQGPFTLQKARIAGIARSYRALVIMDSTGLGDPILEDLQREGITIDGFKMTSTSKQQMIEKLASFIEQKAISIPPRQELWDELDAFGYELSESGNVKYGAPQGIHDDCVISLALAVWGLPSIRRTSHLGTVKEWKKLRIERLFFALKPIIKVRGFDYA